MKINVPRQFCHGYPHSTTPVATMSVRVIAMQNCKIMVNRLADGDYKDIKIIYNHPMLIILFNVTNLS